MSIIPQPRRRIATDLRIAIWSAFVIALVLPLLFARAGHPYYGALVLRPGSWILNHFGNPGASDRAVTLLSFIVYTIVIYAIVRLLRPRRAGTVSEQVPKS